MAAILKRSRTHKNSGNSISAGPFTIDFEKYVITKNDKPFSLPKKEFELLTLLLKKPGKVFTRENILHEVWGGEVFVGERTIDVHIRKLREKIGGQFIKTVKGVGYKFEY